MWYILTHFRAILAPLKERLKTWLVILMSLIILAGSFGLVAFTTFHLKYYESNFAFYQNTTYVYSMCLNRLSKEEYFYSKLSEFSVGIWIPIFVIAAVYISMYSHLKKKARKRKSSSTQDSTVQMQQILRTFLITVFAFFLCLLPMTIFQTVSAHQKWYQSSKYYILSHIKFFVKHQVFRECFYPLFFNVTTLGLMAENR